MDMKLSEQELKQAMHLGTVKQTREQLADHIRRANRLVIRALYHADIDYPTAQKFINDNLDFYAPLNILHAELGHVKPLLTVWTVTMDKVTGYALTLCQMSYKEAHAFHITD